MESAFSSCAADRGPFLRAGGGRRTDAKLRLPRIAPLVGYLVLLVFLPAAGLAAPGDLIRRIVSPEVQPGVNFGEVIAADGKDILVGEPAWWDGTAPFVGRAYLVDGTTGSVKHTLRNPEPDARDSFGISVAVVGDRLVVGAPDDKVGATYSAGSVYTFDRETGGLVTTIPAPNPDSLRFGNSVTPAGRNILVGAPSERVGDAPFAGAVYLLDAQTGEVVSYLPNPEPDLNDLFSFRYAVAGLGEERIVVGSLLNSFGGDYEAHIGSVYVLDQYSSRTLYQIDNPGKVPPLDPGLFDEFGFSLATVAGNIVVSAMSADFGGISNSGAIYVFDGESGELQSLIGNPNPGPYANFGRSVTAVNEDILVGAWGETVDGVEAAGAVYLFDGQNGNLLLHIQNPEPEPFDQFGWAVAAFENNILVGARSDSPFGVPAAGSVYLFRGVPEPTTLSMCTVSMCSLGFLAWRRFPMGY